MGDRSIDFRRRKVSNTEGTAARSCGTMSFYAIGGNHMSPVQLSVGGLPPLNSSAFLQEFGMAPTVCVSPKRLEFNRLLTSLPIFYSTYPPRVGHFVKWIGLNVICVRRIVAIRLSYIFFGFDFSYNSKDIGSGLLFFNGYVYFIRATATIGDTHVLNPSGFIKPSVLCIYHTKS